MTLRNTLPPRYRLGVLSRAVAAIAGGYVLAAACSASFALALPMARSQAVLTGMLASILVYAGAALWAFAARSAATAWAGIAIPAVAMLGIVWWLGPAG